MCVIIISDFECNHQLTLDCPLLNACEAKDTLSRIRGEDVRCEEKDAEVWHIKSDQVCADCADGIYRFEKQYEITKKLEDGGYADRVSLSFFAYPRKQQEEFERSCNLIVLFGCRLPPCQQ